MSSTWRHIFETSGARVLTLLVSLASLSITARVLGPDGRGIIGGAATWINLLATLGSLSIGQVVIERAATNRDGEWMGTVFGAGVVLVCGLSGLVWLGALATASFAPYVFGQLPWWALAVVLIAVPFAMWERFGSQLLVCSGHLRFFNTRLVVASVLGFIALVIVLILLEWGVIGGLIVTALSSVMVSTLGAQKLWNATGKSFTLNMQEVFSLVRNGLKLHLHTIGGTLLTLSGVLVVNSYRSASEVGWYQLAVQMIMALMIVPQAVWLVLNEKITGIGPEKIWPLQRKLLVQSIAVMMLLIAVSYMMAPYAIMVIAGEGFSPSIELFRIMLPSAFGMSLSYFMGSQWLGRGLFGQTALLTALLGGTNLILNMIFVPTFGVSAAAWSMTIVYSMMILTNLGMAAYVELRWQSAPKCLTS
jgi:O-antigen/teichoic acid export membrane protein